MPTLLPSRRLLALLACLSTWGCSGPERQATPTNGTDAASASVSATTTPPSTAMPKDQTSAPSSDPTPAPAANAKATFGIGCFWCGEAVFERLDGVLDAVSGFMGGSVDHPTYKQVCTGETGHAEVVEITYDPARISYETLLAWFFKAHDPTTRNRQGADEGTQYRSVIFYRGEAQRTAALAAIKQHQPDFARPIVTEVTAAGTFWPAEQYHQDFYRNNTQHPYCRAVIAPKLSHLPVGKANDAAKK